mmetsp:Transcript_27308/g.75960  ORF Transcript_27308/g.75960 Transcript_27308/m.75960 type:complete len:563 (-) Transcript_27308:159-1847(-)
MRLPLDRFCPAVHGWLQLMHLDHLFEFNSRIRLMLLVSCCISLFFAITWLVDIFQLSCFSESPWTKEGLGQYTCVYQLVGGVVLLFMFQHSAMALAYYDEDGDELRLKKEQYLGELERQCTDVLSRANGQAKKMTGMLTADLDDKVKEHVDRMRTILEKIKGQRPNAAASRVYDRLVEMMARHLHQLRQPAMQHFEKLISLSTSSRFLADALHRMKQQSMVEVLTGVRGPIRTETTDADPEFGFGGGFAIFTDYAPSTFNLGNWGFDNQPQIQRNSSMDRRLRLPTEGDLRDELQDLTSDDLKNNPAKAVLKPLRVVLKWFMVIKPEGKTVGRGFGGGRTPVSNRNIGGRVDDVWSKAGLVCYHIQHSNFYKWMVLGIMCSVFFVYMYCHMLVTVIDVIGKGECPRLVMFTCVGAFFRQIAGIVAMCLYTVSLGTVLWNVDKLDAVLQVQQEIDELQNFKSQMDRLNAHDLTDADSSVSMIQTVEDQLIEQKRLVGVFFNKAWGQSPQLADFENLASELEVALLRPPPGCKTPAGGMDESPANDDERRRLVGEGSEEDDDER